MPEQLLMRVAVLLCPWSVVMFMLLDCDLD